MVEWKSDKDSGSQTGTRMTDGLGNVWTPDVAKLLKKIKIYDFFNSKTSRDCQVYGHGKHLVLQRGLIYFVGNF